MLIFAQRQSPKLKRHREGYEWLNKADEWVAPTQVLTLISWGKISEIQVATCAWSDSNSERSFGGKNMKIVQTRTNIVLNKEDALRTFIHYFYLSSVSFLHVHIFYWFHTIFDMQINNCTFLQLIVCISSLGKSKFIIWFSTQIQLPITFTRRHIQ